MVQRDMSKNSVPKNVNDLMDVNQFRVWWRSAALRSTIESVRVVLVDVSVNFESERSKARLIGGEPSGVSRAFQ